MKQYPLARTASRLRQDRRISILMEMCLVDLLRFDRAWGKLVQVRLGGICNRVNAQRAGDSWYWIQVFAGLEMARSLAKATGTQVRKTVQKSLVLLQHHCAMAMAPLTKRCLYSFVRHSVRRVQRP